MVFQIVGVLTEGVLEVHLCDLLRVIGVVIVGFLVYTGFGFRTRFVRRFVF